MEQQSTAVDINNADHKYYFSHYANSAVHNVLMILNHISLKLGFEATINDTKNSIDHHPLLKIDPNTDIEKYTRCLNLLTRHLPVIIYLQDDNNPKTVLARFKELLYDLLLHRNFFAHYYYVPSSITRDHFHLEIGQNSIHYSKLSYAVLLRKAIKEVRRRKKQIFLDSDFEQVLTRPESSTEYDLKAHIFDLSNERSATKRTAFLLCLFLERRMANLLISRVYGLRDTRTTFARVTREIFLQFCCKVPYPKLESGALWLDMLNELQKIPALLYNALGDKDKQCFDPNKSTDPGDNEDNLPKPVMKRHKDRFPRLCLQFFDDTDYIPGLQFQIFLGQLCIKRYSKLIGTKKQERRIVKDMSVFGKLSDYVHKKNIPQSWLADVPVITTTRATTDDAQAPVLDMVKDVGGDVVSYTPRYQITNAGIGCIFNDTNWPNWTAHNNDGIRQLAFNYRTRPDAILPVNELPNLFLYAYLEKEIANINLASPINFLKEYVRNIRQCIEDIQNGTLLPISNQSDLREKLAIEYRVKLSDLPEIVRSYISGKQEKSINDQLLGKLEAHMKDTCAIYDIIKDPEMKFERGKQKKAWTKGKAGTYLAQDMIRFMRHEKKPSDFHYNHLQKYIALWGPNIMLIDDLLVQLQIMGTECHLFFHSGIQEYMTAFQTRVASHNKRSSNKITYNLKRFFKHYLETKKQYLNNAFEMIKNGTMPDTELALLTKIFKIRGRGRHTWQYADLHIRLPRGIFTQVIKNAIKNYRGDNECIKEIANSCRDSVTKNGTCGLNPTYLISKLFPDTQPFYTRERSYNLQDINRGHPETYTGSVFKWREELKEKKGIGNNSLLYNRIDNREKDIRSIQKTDRLLWKMVDVYVRRMIKSERTTLILENPSWNLTHVGFDINDGYNALNIKVDMRNALYDKTIKASKSIKEYGEFCKIRHDKRLKALFAWFKEEEIDFDDIRRELEEYDAQRHKVLQDTFELEKRIISCMAETDIQNNRKEYRKDSSQSHFSIPFSKCMSFLSKTLNSELLDIDGRKIQISMLNKFRNSLEHNLYPELSHFQVPVREDFIERVSKGNLRTTCICEYLRSVFQVAISRVPVS